MERTPVLVLGVGNLLWADEGLGVRSVEALDQQYQCGPNVTVMDGGTQGLYLVNEICAADRLLLLDAVDFGDSAGTLRILRNEEVPRFTSAKKMSMHQTGMQDVLAAAEWMGFYPREVVLIGVQPDNLTDFGGSLSPTVAARVPDVVAAALAQLAAWGETPVRRTVPGVSLVATGLEQHNYEANRPSRTAACRQGDPRVLPTGWDG